MEIFFNKSKIQHNLIHTMDENIVFEIYNTINFTPKDRYRAFFDYSNFNYSFMIYLLFSHINDISTINEFIKILENKDYILESISNFFANKPFLDIEETFLLELDSKNTISSLLLILNSYEIVLKELTKDLKNLSNIISNKFIINKDKLKQTENLNEYEKIIHEYEFKVDEISYYGISLLNPYGMKKNRDVWIFGYLAKLEYNNQSTVLHLTYDNIMSTLSNQISMDIIQLLSQKNFLTANELAEKLNWSVPVLYKYLSDLRYKHAIIVHKEKRINFYSINPEFFRQAEKIISRKFKTFYM